MWVHVTRPLTLFSRSKYFNLSDMCVSPAVLVLQYGDLHKHSFYVWFEYLPSGTFFLKLKVKPSDGFFKVYEFDLLKFIETIANSYRDFLRSIGLISFEVEIHRNFLHSHFFQELDIDEMWLSAVTLPERGHRVISQLLYSVTWLGRGESPNG